jgi:hypothetical protein
VRTFGRARVNKVCRATYSALRADTAGVWGKQAVLMANGRAQAQFMAWEWPWAWAVETFVDQHVDTGPFYRDAQIEQSSWSSDPPEYAVGAPRRPAHASDVAPGPLARVGVPNAERWAPW